MDVLEYFTQYNDSFPDSARIAEFKEKGRRVFGWLCTYIPEELIHAAGALPIRVTGYSQEKELEDGTAFLYGNTCSFSRSCLQMAIDKKLDFLDGLIGGSTCDGARRLYDQWTMFLGVPFSHMVTVPRKYNEGACALYCGQIAQLKERLEEYLNVTITDSALEKSIELYNRSRTLMRGLYELRKLQSPPVSGADVMEIANASYRMPKETFNDYMEILLAQLEHTSKKYEGRARIMLAGSIMTNPEFVRSIEEVEAVVVIDELCTTTRYWSDPVVLDGSRSPLEALGWRYINNYPCARMVPCDERFDRIIDSIRNYRVDGVISQTIRYCVPYAHDLPLLTERLQAEGIPSLSLDLEYGSSGSGQIRTRVQAFIEMLEARKK